MLNKFFVYGFAVVFVLLLFACGQERPLRQRRSPAESAELLKEKLALTEAQKDQIQEILEDQQERMQEFRDTFSGDRVEMREAVRDLREETDRLIEELLTDEQKNKYEEFKEERRQNMRDRFRERDER